MNGAGENGGSKKTEAEQLGSEILETACDIGERQDPEAEETQAAVGAATVGPMTCLVVEDNLVNQQVLTAMLESMGHVVRMAENGVEAVDAYEPGLFDVIFMDIQMAEMDGYEATLRIRKLEGGRSHVPIIAVTANAMKGDREACREVGMDDYIPKPIDPVKLAAAIERTGNDPDSPQAIFGTDQQLERSDLGDTAMAATLDLSVLDKLRDYQCEGQPDIVTRLIDLFLGQAPNHVEAVEVALAASDAEALSRAAHALKGASANFGATKLTELSALLERQGREGNIAGSVEIVPALVREYELVETDLSAQRLPLSNET
jgi:CheY-like chemotaxis protein/HPt (histidine-containing phosphotransfer) domain-containing protein